MYYTKPIIFFWGGGGFQSGLLQYAFFAYLWLAHILPCPPWSGVQGWGDWVNIHWLWVGPAAHHWPDWASHGHTLIAGWEVLAPQIHWQVLCGEAASWTLSEQILETRLQFKGWLYLGPLCRQYECFITSSQSSLPCYLSLPLLSSSFSLTLPVSYPLLPAHPSLISSLPLSPFLPSSFVLAPPPFFLPLTYTPSFTSFLILPISFICIFLAEYTTSHSHILTSSAWLWHCKVRMYWKGTIQCINFRYMCMYNNDHHNLVISRYWRLYGGPEGCTMWQCAMRR